MGSYREGPLGVGMGTYRSDVGGGKPGMLSALAEYAWWWQAEAGMCTVVAVTTACPTCEGEV